MPAYRGRDRRWRYRKLVSLPSGRTPHAEARAIADAMARVMPQPQIFAMSAKLGAGTEK